MPSILANFATGFLRTASDELSERSKREAELDKMRQERVMQADLETSVYEAKKRIDEKQKQAQIERNQKMFLETDAAMQGVPVGEEVADDSELGLETVKLAPVEVAESTPLGIENAQAVRAPVSQPQVMPSQRHGASALSGLTPEQTEVIRGMVMGGADSKEIYKQQYEFKQENLKPQLELQKSKDVADMVMNEPDPERKRMLASQYKIDLPKEEESPEQQMAYAEELAVPYIPNPYKNAKEPEKYINEGRKQLDKEYEKVVAPAENSVFNLKRLDELNTIIDTGGASGLLAKGKALLGVGDKVGEAASEYESIVAKMTPEQRVPGSGSSSDLDVKMFEKALPGLGKPTGANKNLITGLMAAKQNEIDKHDLKARFLDANKHLSNGEINKVWKQYVEANPIFDKSSTPEKLVLNKDRMNFEEWFRNKDSMPAQGNLPVENADDGWSIEEIQ